MVPWLFKDY
jgi:hypothetical protein